MTDATESGEIDRLLAEFFRRQRPDPWPPAPETASAAPLVRGMAAGMPARSGRWSLAVSLAAVAALAVLLSGRMPAPPTGPVPPLDTGTANVPKHLRGR